MKPGLAEQIASAAYSCGMLAGAQLAISRYADAEAMEDFGSLRIETMNDRLGGAGGWAAAWCSRLERERAETIARDLRTEVARYVDGGRLLPSLLGEARHPGAVLAARLVRSARAARRAWRGS